MSLILPSRYRSRTLDPTRFRGYARHIPCGGEAFWFTRFGKAWFEMTATEIYFEDGQIKIVNRPIEEYRCSSCGSHLAGRDLKLVKIIQDDEARDLHRAEHTKTTVGNVCDICGKRKQ